MPYAKSKLVVQVAWTWFLTSKMNSWSKLNIKDLGISFFGMLKRYRCSIIFKLVKQWTLHVSVNVCRKISFLMHLVTKVLKQWLYSMSWNTNFLVIYPIHQIWHLLTSELSLPNDEVIAAIKKYFSDLPKYHTKGMEIIYTYIHI